ncbi:MULTISPECIES: DUF835 domain-containing protein [unclassified Thermococcus]|uniref:DUF835 domain-containing protein n=1 Tax=unclassified Thermococcus TaxID=2627626 RepID=UPI00143CB68E|nr:MULTISPECIES: DUF835 domain-containing protein [unclassified Thermococcus]
MALGTALCAVNIYFDYTENWVSVIIFKALFVSLFAYGALRLVQEESLLPDCTVLKILPATPIAVSLYWIAYHLWRGLPFTQDSISIPYAISGIFLFLASLFMYTAKEIYPSAARKLAIIIGGIGVNEIVHPFIRSSDIGNLLQFTILMLIALGVYYLNKLGKEVRFRGIPEEKHQTEILIVDSKEYSQLKKRLENSEILIFTREYKEFPKLWKNYFISTINGDNVISPVNLPKILDLSKRHFENAQKKGESGVVIIDCIEYLNEYNGFNTVVKFLTRLRDFSFLYGGNVFVSTSRDVWEKKEFALLETLLR